MSSRANNEIILGMGAEATIKLSSDIVVKERFKKSYRHPALDASLRKFRSRREFKMLQKARKLIPVPETYEGSDNSISMEYVRGVSAKDVLDSHIYLAKTIGVYLGLLHKHDLIHGDLTTSNVLVRSESPIDKGSSIADKDVLFIDFGLSFSSKKLEDKAVDIHLFKQALQSKHHEVFSEAYELFVEGYASSLSSAKEVLLQLARVERRGRNKAKH